MSINIKNLYHYSQDVGKTIKITKRYYCWEFNLDDKFRKIELFHSKLSAKRKISYNGSTLTEEDGSYFDNDFRYTFTLNKHIMLIVQQNDVFYELSIDGKSFEQLMIDDKNKDDCTTKKNEEKRKNFEDNYSDSEPFLNL